MMRSVSAFIEKLYSILSIKANHRIIRWNSDGTSFIIVNPSTFRQSILPLYFKHRNLSSFVRQLNKYDFKKVRNSSFLCGKYGDNYWEFKNPLFKRNKTDFLCSIRAKKNKESECNINTQRKYKIKGMAPVEYLNSLQNILEIQKLVLYDINVLREEVISYGWNKLPRVLVCEEQEESKKYEPVFKNNGFIFFIAHDYTEAIDIIYSYRVDLIVINTSFKGCSDILEYLRNNAQEVKIALLIENELELKSIKKENRVGYVSFYLKPINELTILNIIKKYFTL